MWSWYFTSINRLVQVQGTSAESQPQFGKLYSASACLFRQSVLQGNWMYRQQIRQSWESVTRMASEDSAFDSWVTQGKTLLQLMTSWKQGSLVSKWAKVLVPCGAHSKCPGWRTVSASLLPLPLLIEIIDKATEEGSKMFLVALFWSHQFGFRVWWNLPEICLVLVTYFFMIWFGVLVQGPIILPKRPTRSCWIL